MKNEKNTKASEDKVVTAVSASGRPRTKIMNMLSYVAVCVGGVALFISFLMDKLGKTQAIASVAETLSVIGNAIGWAVLSILSFFYIIRRRRIWMWVVWAVAVVMIVLNFVL